MKARFLPFAFAVMIVLAVIVLANKRKSEHAASAPAQTFVDEPAPNPVSVGGDGEIPAAEVEPERMIVKGETTILTHTIGGVTVVNIKPVSDDDVSVSLGSSCDITDDGTLTVVGFNGEDVLVRFSKATRLHRKNTRKAVGPDDDHPDQSEETQTVTCPSGILFFCDKGLYLDDTQPSQSDTVLKLLKEERAAKP